MKNVKHRLGNGCGTWKIRSSVLHARANLTKILMLMEKFQSFRIRCIMLILDILKNIHLIRSNHYLTI